MVVLCSVSNVVLVSLWSCFDWANQNPFKHWIRGKVRKWTARAVKRRTKPSQQQQLIFVQWFTQNTVLTLIILSVRLWSCIQLFADLIDCPSCCVLYSVGTSMQIKLARPLVFAIDPSSRAWVHASTGLFAHRPTRSELDSSFVQPNYERNQQSGWSWYWIKLIFVRMNILFQLDDTVHRWPLLASAVQTSPTMQCLFATPWSLCFIFLAKQNHWRPECSVRCPWAWFTWTPLNGCCFCILIGCSSGPLRIHFIDIRSVEQEQFGRPIDQQFTDFYNLELLSTFACALAGASQ